MSRIINLKERFKEEICSFEVAKKAKEAGMTCANTYLAYNNDGSVTTGAWLESVGYNHLYPCINFVLACIMVEDVCPNPLKIELTENDGIYFFYYEGQSYQSNNIVDVMIEFWIKNNRKK
jgi:hypothetical protein